MAQLAIAPDDRMSLVEHLGALRRALIISSAAWAAASIVAFAFHNVVLSVLLQPLTTTLSHGNHLVQTAIFTSPSEGLSIPMKLSAIIGVVLALPVILWQIWKFVSPGLRPIERKFAGPFILSSIILFAAGAAFAYFVMPVGLNFLATFLGGDAQYLPDINAYLSFLLLLIVAFGLTFELPVVIVLLGTLGVVSAAWLRAHRVSAWLAIVGIALVVTPGADPFTPAALAIPLVILFEVSILVVAKVLRR